MSDAAPNTKHVQIVVEVPRDPDAYRRSLHFREHLRYRRDPDVEPWIVEEVIEEGRCRGERVDGSTVVDPDAVANDSEVFAFEKTVWSQGEHDWTVIVAVNPDAYVNDGEHHELVTAYCPCHDDELENCDGADSLDGVVG